MNCFMNGEKTLALYRLCWIVLLGIGLQGCGYEIEDIEEIEERMELQSSALEVTLNADQLTADIITFNWTEARSVSGESMISYRTKLDVLGNNFGVATTIMSHEDEGVLTKSFSSEQLQNWANEKWGLPVNKPFTLQFRVIAEYEGGQAFHAPEVRTVTVNVQPIRTVVFDADKIFLTGSAINGSAKVELQRTVENENQYAVLLDLQAGSLEIPVEYEGATNFLCPKNSDGGLHDGTAVEVNMREQPIGWEIPQAGQYRLVVNMQKATCTIYSPATALQPKVVTWNADGGISRTTEVNELWMHGAINGWAAPIKMDCSVSLADPQVLIYQGGRTGKAKFIVYGENDNNKNLAYAFSCPLTGSGDKQELTLTIGKVSELSGGMSSAQRNSYYTIPAGANFLVFDLRNMTLLAEKR